MNLFICFILLASTCFVRPAAAHISQDMPDAVAEMEYRILLDFQPEKNDIRNKLGMALFRMKKIAKAEKEFKIVLANDPKNFNAIDAMGLVMLNRGQLQEALAHFNTAKAINPADILVYYHLGLAYVQLKKLSLAKDALQTSLENSAVPGQTPLSKQVKAELVKAKKLLGQVGSDLAKGRSPSAAVPQ
jgi:tetratricopeptide (TPR) repeat protein